MTRRVPLALLALAPAAWSGTSRPPATPSVSSFGMISLIVTDLEVRRARPCAGSRPTVHRLDTRHRWFAAPSCDAGVKRVREGLDLRVVCTSDEAWGFPPVALAGDYTVDVPVGSSCDRAVRVPFTVQGWTDAQAAEMALDADPSCFPISQAVVAAFASWAPTDLRTAPLLVASPASLAEARTLFDAWLVTSEGLRDLASLLAAPEPMIRWGAALELLDARRFDWLAEDQAEALRVLTADLPASLADPYAAWVFGDWRSGWPESAESVLAEAVASGDRPEVLLYAFHHPRPNREDVAKLTALAAERVPADPALATCIRALGVSASCRAPFRTHAIPSPAAGCSALAARWGARGMVPTLPAWQEPGQRWPPYPRDYMQAWTVRMGPAGIVPASTAPR